MEAAGIPARRSLDLGNNTQSSGQMLHAYRMLTSGHS